LDFKKKFDLKLFLFLACFSITSNADIDDYVYRYSNVSSYSNYSTLGLIQNPSARFNPAGTIGFNWSSFEPYLQGSIVAYPFDWMEAAYQYTDVNNALYSNSKDFSGAQTYKDKGFDAKFRLFSETLYLPQIALGIRDLAGSGTFGAEYLVASKFLKFDKFLIDASFGLGWGGLSNNDFSNPLTKLSDRFEERSMISDTQGGEFNIDRYFSGNMGIFGGMEIFLPNLRGARIKIEYDGTNYKAEGFPFGNESSKFAFEPVKQSQSRLNYGILLPINKSFHLKAAFTKGNTITFGFSLSGFWGPKDPLIQKKDNFREVENKEIVQKVTADSDLYLYRAALIELKKNNIYVQNANRDDDTLKVAYAQAKFSSFSRSTGRAAQVLDSISPKEISTFKLESINAGMSMNEVTIDRKSFHRLQEDNLYKLAKKDITITSSHFEKESYDYNPEGGFPATFWKISPVIRSQIGGPDGFYFGDISLGYNSETKFSRNIALITQAQVGVVNNFGELKLSSDSILPHVRSDIVKYLKSTRDYSVRRVQLNIFNNPFKNIYTKFSAGLLEEMFSGYGGEILYRPFHRNFAIGAELWKVKQREYNMLLKHLDYETLTGHINLYYKEPRSQVILTMRGGRFLAKDSGITFDFSRKFPSGLRMGAFFSLTDISEQEFGEGSFDKGFYFHIPMEIFFDKYSKGYTGFGLKPLTRDGAALLNHAYHLWGVTDDGQLMNLDDWTDLYD
jgi:hypothetical protein